MVVLNVMGLIVVAVEVAVCVPGVECKNSMMVMGAEGGTVNVVVM